MFSVLDVINFHVQLKCDLYVHVIHLVLSFLIATQMWNVMMSDLHCFREKIYEVGGVT
jgi:hypothetical protein